MNTDRVYCIQCRGGSVLQQDLSESAKDNIRSRIASTVQSASIPDNNFTKDEQQTLKRLKQTPLNTCQQLPSTYKQLIHNVNETDKWTSNRPI